MELLAKFTDAASMFWQSLSDDERRLLLYAGAYLAVSLVLGVQAKAAESRERRLREEVRAVLRENGSAV